MAYKAAPRALPWRRCIVDFTINRFSIIDLSLCNLQSAFESFVLYKTLALQLDFVSSVYWGEKRQKHALYLWFGKQKIVVHCLSFVKESQSPRSAVPQFWKETNKIQLYINSLRNTNYLKLRTPINLLNRIQYTSILTDQACCQELCRSLVVSESRNTPEA